MKNPDIDFLKKHNFQDTAHGTRCLLNHLIGVECVLRGWECEESTCRAGLFHSVLGTPSFNKIDLSSDFRTVVSQYLDKPTLQIVEEISESPLFHTLEQHLSQEFEIQLSPVVDVWIANFVDTLMNNSIYLSHQKIGEFFSRYRKIEKLASENARAQTRQLVDFFERNNR